MAGVVGRRKREKSRHYAATAVILAKKASIQDHWRGGAYDCHYPSVLGYKYLREPRQKHAGNAVLPRLI
jgi:hypothetical protein